MIHSMCLFFLIFLSNLSACTGFLLKAKDGSAINGRTVEFGSNIEMSVAVIPRNYKFVGDVPKGKGKEYKSKYAACGIYCFADKKLMDGINEKGLVAAAFYFPGYAGYSDSQSDALSPAEFPNWILTQFATVEEVKEALPTVAIAPTVLKGWGPTPPPMHYIVYDKDGKSIVIEPIDGKLVLHENPIGVITNSPTFDWHLTNLVNYINLSPNNVNPIDIRGLKLTPFGQGSGLLGLPGDFTPPSRFVRATIFSISAIPTSNASETVDQAFHILNQFDIPAGAVRSKDGYDSTLLTSVKDPSNNRYYFRSYDNQAIRFIELKQFNLNAKEIKDLKVKGKQKSEDVSSLLKV